MRAGGIGGRRDAAAASAFRRRLPVLVGVLGGGSGRWPAVLAAHARRRPPRRRSSCVPAAPARAGPQRLAGGAAARRAPEAAGSRWRCRSRSSSGRGERRVAAAAQVAPLRRTLQADLLIVAPFSLSGQVLTAVSPAARGHRDRADRGRGSRSTAAYTAVLGVDPSVFRAFAARPTGASNALWQGVADGGIAVSYTMGTLDRLSLGGTVTAAGRTHEEAAGGGVRHGGHRRGQRRGLGRDRPVARRARPTTRSWSARRPRLDRRWRPRTRRSCRAARRRAAGDSLISAGGRRRGASGGRRAGPTSGSAARRSSTTLLKAAVSRRGLPYVWGAAGPTSFDCSGLVQWSFAQAGIAMPRVAADQALDRARRARQPAPAR